MTKRTKRKIAARPRGLVIPIPQPRPEADDDPSKILFREAVEQAKAATSSPTPNVSHTSNVSLTPNTSLTPEVSQALRGVSLAPDVSLTADVSHTQNPANLWASIPEVKGHTKLFHQITDHLLKLLDPIEQVVYIQLFRLSWGWGKPTCNIALPHLAERANVGTTAVHNAVKRLVSKGLVEKTGYIMGKGKNQGCEYRLTLPVSLTREASLTSNASLTPRTDNKEKSFKEKNIKGERLTPQEIKQCPDCHGTGWFEVEPGKGVSRCQHPQVRKAQAQ